MQIHFRVPEIVLGAFLAMAVFAMGMLFQSSLPSPDHQAQQSGNHSAESRPSKVAGPNSPDERIANYTWWLSAFTLALVVVSGFQIFFLTRADKTARITAQAALLSAKAAKKSSDTAMGVALPRFAIESIDIDRRESIEDALKNGILVARVKNHGTTMALVFSQSIVVVVDTRLPDIPDYPPNTIEDLAREWAVESGGTYESSVPGRFALGLKPNEIDAVVKKEKLLWVYGYIEYRDFLDTVTRKGFCGVLRHDWTVDERYELIQAGPEAYTYTHRTDHKRAHTDTTA